MQGPGHNATVVAQALVARNAVDIGGKGVAFSFRSHQEMWDARVFLSDSAKPGNVRWAFHMSAANVEDMIAVCGVIPAAHQHKCTPKIETHMLTSFTTATGCVIHDDYTFFALP